MVKFANLFTSFLSGLSPKEKRLLYLSFAVLFFLFFDKVAYSPLAQRIETLNDNIETQKKMIRKNLLLIQHKDKIILERKKYQKFFSEEKLTHEEKVAKFLSEVENIARDSGIVLTNINPVEIKENPGYSTYTLTIECRGDMADFMKFIYLIDNSPKPLRVISSEINPQQRAQYTVGVTLEIEKLIIAPGEKDGVFLGS